MKKSAFLITIVFLLFFVQNSKAQNGGVPEICNNAIDDDGDGYIDINDSDCICNQQQVRSVIPNHSFEQYTACPDYLSQMHYAAPWVQATTNRGLGVATTDYFNTCGYLGASASMVPFPDGNGIAGIIVENDYKEYAGTCLLSPLQAGTQYRLTFNVASVKDGHPDCNDGDVSIYEALNLTLYGTVNCTALPAQNTMDAPTADPNWKILGSTTYTPVSQWGLVTITFTPQTNINAIMLGAPEVLPGGYPVWHPDTMVSCYPYFLFDNLILNVGLEFGLDVNQSGALCNNDLVLSAIPSQPLSSSAVYQWYKNGIAIIGATTTAYNVIAGPDAYATYALRITDGINCFIGYTDVNSDLPAPQASTVPVCVPGTGAITVSTPAPFYSFDNGATWTASSIAQNLLPGFYGVRIKNAQGCISNPAYIEITEFTLAAPAFTTRQPVDCANGGSITINTAAFQYSFNNGTSWQDTPALSGLTGGDYNVRIKNQEGCISHSVFVHINEFHSAAPSYRAVQPNCSTDGILTIITAAQQYSFNGGMTWQDSPILGNINTGYYEMMVKDANGCTSYPSFEFIAPAETRPNAPQATVQHPLSCMAQTGRITITTTASQYSFDDGVTWGSSNTSGALPPGSYIIKIKNAAGCQSPGTIVSINFPPDIPIRPQPTVLQPDCTSPTGSISITTPADFYSFDNGMTWTAINFKSGLTPGSYFIKTKNSSGCESEVVEVGIVPSSVTPVPIALLVNYCENAIAAPLTATGSNLLWYTAPAGGTASNNAPVPDTSVPGTAIFYVSQTVNGCESQRVQIVVTITPVPATPLIIPEIYYCQNSVTLPLTAIGSNLVWYTDPAGGAGSTEAPVPQSTVPGTTIWYVSQVVNGCESGRAITEVIINEQPKVPQVVSPVIYHQGDNAVALTATGNSLKWYNDNGVLLAFVPVPKTNAAGATAYYVTQTVNGCESELSEIIVEVLPKPVLFDYPKFFTPNNDGAHEYWNIYDLRNDRKAIIYIFDRYGKLITSVRPYEKGWDGKYNGQDLPATDYWFRLLFTQNGIQQEFKGHFSLLR